MAEIIAAEFALDRAEAVIASGGLAAIPTETVYGLAADAASGAAVARIFEAKRRPRFNPLIAHVADRAMADRLAVLDPLSEKLADAFWPGPLTLVVDKRPGAPFHDLVTAGLDTVALRMPLGFAHDLIARLGRPLAAPSANSSGRISATSAQAVERDLGKRIDLIVDGGRTPVGLESTIVKAEAGRLRILRPGGVAAEAIEAAIGQKLLRGHGAGIEAPGQLASHYAPRAGVLLDATEIGADDALLAFGADAVRGQEQARAVLNLSPSGDLREAAANLFAHLQALDASGTGLICVAPIPDHGLGEAINDRLRRAAAPRPGD